MKQEFDTYPNKDIVGSFTNDVGERWVLYRIWGVARDFVTGDEVDRELGWYWDRGSSMLRQDFILTGGKVDGLEEILNQEKRK